MTPDDRAQLRALLDAAAFLDEVRGQVARGALCPTCSTGMTRQTVGMVCQLCGTDYARPEYASLRRDSEQTTKAALAEALAVRADRDALAAKVERVRALHFGEYVEDEDRNRCFECGDDYPCPTRRALTDTPDTPDDDTPRSPR